MKKIFATTLKLAIVLGSALAAQAGHAATCEFKVPVKSGVFEEEFTVVGKGATSEKALADAAMKCFARFERDHGGRVAASDQSLDAIDVCANPPGC